MVDRVCLPYFHFLLLVVALFAFAVWAVYNLTQYTQCQMAKSKDSNLFGTLTKMFNFSLSQPPIPVGNPDDVDDFGLGELPPARRDYRKMNDPLKQPSRRYTDYPTGGPVDGIFNVPTQGYFPSYQMLGYLSKPGDSDRMLKLFGRRTDKYRWEYYTTHYDDPQLKIPIKTKGDKELMSGDDLKIDSIPGDYKVNLYDYESPKYIPYVH